jgi:hypothetical protein
LLATKKAFETSQSWGDHGNKWFKSLEQCEDLLDFYVEPIQTCVVRVPSTIKLKMTLDNPSFNLEHLVDVETILSLACTLPFSEM